MRRVTGEGLENIKPFFILAALAAEKSTCYKARCGSVIVKDGEIIAKGYNSPPLNDESSRMCNIELDNRKTKYDRTCCVHAEWRAILSACKRSEGLIEGSTLYFMRIDENGKFTDAGDPFCTDCSRLSMESGVTQFALWNDNGADIYAAAEYNQKSYSFYSKRITTMLEL